LVDEEGIEKREGRFSDCSDGVFGLQEYDIGICDGVVFYKGSCGVGGSWVWRRGANGFDFFEFCDEESTGMVDMGSETGDFGSDGDWCLMNDVAVWMCCNLPRFREVRTPQYCGVPTWCVVPLYIIVLYVVANAF
jgi:hypothetical protein